MSDRYKQVRFASSGISKVDIQQPSADTVRVNRLALLKRKVIFDWDLDAERASHLALPRTF